LPFSLRIEEGKFSGRRYVFDQAEVVLGRTPENDVVVPDDGASRKHAKISQEGEGYQVEDMNSSNGTRVNGQPLTKPLTLRDGDLVQIGDVKFKFGVQQVAPNATRIVAVSDLPQWDRPSTALARSPGGALAARGPGGAAGGALARPGGAAKAGGAARKPLPKRVRLMLFGVGGLVGLMILAKIAQKIVGGGASTGPVAQEAEFDLGSKPDLRYYGLGPDVDVPAPGRAAFIFNFSEPVPGKSLLTFHCSTDGVAKPEDIEVRLNGHHLGYLPATFGDARPVDWLLDRHQLITNAENRVEFINLRRPPSNWEVFGLWIEQESLPTGTPDQLLIEAKSEYSLAENRLGNEQVAAANLHDAWLHFKRARLVLAAMPVANDQLQSLVTARLSEVTNRLDHKCHEMLFTANKDLHMRGPDKAMETLKDVLNYFPVDDHPCYEKTQKMINQL
jgi:pSer/pThr/pTyr-binding forkhead associated (FHA) protein